MPHGTPDWGITSGYKTVYQLTDMAELAVRLGSIVSFDRRGDVIFLDGFEEGLYAWGQEQVGGGAKFQLTTGYHRSGGLGVRLLTSSGAPYDVILIRELFYPVLSKIGLEFHWGFLNALASLDVSLALYSGAIVTGIILRYQDSPRRWQILVAGSTYEDIDVPRQPLIGYGHFYSVKLVFDLETSKYVRLILPNEVIDLSAYALPSFADISLPRMVLSFNAKAADSTQRYCYLDDVIITQNEP